MPQMVRRFSWINRFSRFALVASLVLIGLSVVWTIAAGVYMLLNNEPGSPPAGTVLTVCAAAVIVELLALGAVVVIYGSAQVVVANEVAVTESASRLGRIESLLESQGDALDRLVDLATLSDQAKSLVYREREVEAFREAIQEDIIRQDYDTARRLIEDIETRFGYTEEADRLRQQVAEGQQAGTEEKVENAVHRIQELLSRQDWAQALRASQRLKQAFPDNETVARLPERIEAARNKHKRQLLQEYGEAVRRDDVDRGIELLRELDRYLSPQEAAALEESARGVFRKKLHNLGVQFAISVADQQWADAVATGEEIVNEFPNTRMAQEVREKLDLLRTRAQADAS